MVDIVEGQFSDAESEGEVCRCKDKSYRATAEQVMSGRTRKILLKMLTKGTISGVINFERDINMADIEHLPYSKVVVGRRWLGFTDGEKEEDESPSDEDIDPVGDESDIEDYTSEEGSDGEKEEDESPSDDAIDPVGDESGIEDYTSEDGSDGEKEEDESPSDDAIDPVGSNDDNEKKSKFINSARPRDESPGSKKSRKKEVKKRKAERRETKVKKHVKKRKKKLMKGNYKQKGKIFRPVPIRIIFVSEM